MLLVCVLCCELKLHEELTVGAKVVETFLNAGFAPATGVHQRVYGTAE